MKKILSVVGARPNFMKVAPLHKEISKQSELTHIICHTGQHYDVNMSDVFFRDLGMPKPHHYLGIGGGSHAAQTGKIMIEFERVILEEKPDLLIVVGDVNSTVACSLVATKLGVRVAHVEAGLRSFDRTMPEEINRIVTDSISDLLFVSEESGVENLNKEGVSDEKIHFVGNVMIDSLTMIIPTLDNSELLKQYSLKKSHYIVVTLHRPSNVDQQQNLTEIVRYLNTLSEFEPVIFPVHPRTRKNLDQFGLLNGLHDNIVLIEPLGYTEFLSLLRDAKLVITDSGGIQEETTYLGVQCITLRENTERPVTVSVGTNHLAGTDMKVVEGLTRDVLNGKKKQGKIPHLWDGKTSERIIKIISNVI